MKRIKVGMQINGLYLTMETDVTVENARTIAPSANTSFMATVTMQFVDVQPVTTPAPEDRFKELRAQLAHGQEIILERIVEQIKEGTPESLQGACRLAEGLKTTLAT